MTFNTHDNLVKNIFNKFDLTSTHTPEEQERIRALMTVVTTHKHGIDAKNEQLKRFCPKFYDEYKDLKFPRFDAALIELYNAIWNLEFLKKAIDKWNVVAEEKKGQKLSDAEFNEICETLGYHLGDIRNNKQRLGCE